MNRFFLTGFFICSVMAFSANAASPIGNVGTSVVNDGEFSIEWRGGYTKDGESRSVDERFQMRQHIDYGFNDWFAIRLVTAQDRRQGDNLEYNGFTWENRFQVVEKRESGWDMGFRVIYGHADGDKTPHELDLRMMWAVPFLERWEWRHNTVVEHDIGENSDAGFALEFRNQATYALEDKPDYVKKLRVGVEMFNDFGNTRELNGYRNQDHQFGPVIKASFPNGSYLQTSYRAGISDSAPDHLFKLFVGHKF